MVFITTFSEILPHRLCYMIINYAMKLLKIWMWKVEAEPTPTQHLVPDF